MTTPSEATAKKQKAGARIDYVRVALGVTTLVAIGALWYTVYHKNASDRKERLFRERQADVIGQLRSPPGGRVQIVPKVSTTPTANGGTSSN